MPKWTLIIPRIPISANKLLRMHWHPRADLLGEWKHDVGVLCKEAKIPMLEHVTVGAVIYFKDKRTRDMDNFTFSLEKMLGDSLKGIIIPDDDPRYLTWGSIEFLHDKLNPRTEVVLNT